MVSNVDCSRHQEEADALPCFFCQKKSRDQATDEAPDERDVLLMLLLEVAAKRAHDRPEEPHEGAHKQSKPNGVLAGQDFKEFCWFFYYFFDGEEHSQASFDEIGRCCDFRSINQYRFKAGGRMFTVGCPLVLI